MVDPELNVTENATPVNDDAKALYDNLRATTTNAEPIYYDLQLRQLDPTKRQMDIQTKQDLVIKSGRINLFMVQGNQIHMNDANKSITFTPGTVRKFEK